LVLIRRPGRRLVAETLGDLAIPLVLGLPVIVLVVTTLVGGLAGCAAAWRTAAVLTGLLVCSGWSSWC
jgi:hypothetical protein